MVFSTRSYNIRKRETEGLRGGEGWRPSVQRGMESGIELHKTVHAVREREGQ